MSLHRYAAKRDANERSIIAALEKLGCSVEQLDVIDLLVFRAGEFRLLEVKARKGRLTPRQIAFRRRFPVHVVRTVREALMAVGLLDARQVVERNADETRATIARTLARMAREYDGTETT